MVGNFFIIDVLVGRIGIVGRRLEFIGSLLIVAVLL